MFKDIAPAPKEIKGHFKIEAIDKDGKVIDTFEDHNLIVNTARMTMAKFLSGRSDVSGITKFLLGTKGHINTDVLLAKEEGKDGYDETRTQLFSEESGSDYFYTVSWDFANLVDAQGSPVTFTGDTVSFIAEGQKRNENNLSPDAENGQIPVTITLADNSVLYQIEIPKSCANGEDGKSVVVFTEAGLKTQDDLFSIKCFVAKVKELSVSFKISWKIIF